MLYLRWRSRLRPFPDFAAISAFVASERDKRDIPSSRFKAPWVFDASGRLIGHVSYNARIWPGLPHDWQPGQVPLYS